MRPKTREQHFEDVHVKHLLFLKLLKDKLYTKKKGKQQICNDDNDADDDKYDVKLIIQI